MKLLFAGALAAALLSDASAAAQSDGEALRAELLRSYPSLAYVERYRRTFPD